MESGLQDESEIETKVLQKQVAANHLGSGKVEDNHDRQKHKKPSVQSKSAPDPQTAGETVTDPCRSTSTKSANWAIPREKVDQLVQMGFDLDAVMQALEAARLDSFRAVEYLLTGIPERTRSDRLIPPASLRRHHLPSSPSVGASVRKATTSSGAHELPTDIGRPSVDVNTATSRYLVSHNSQNIGADTFESSSSRTSRLGAALNDNSIEQKSETESSTPIASAHHEAKPNQTSAVVQKEQVAPFSSADSHLPSSQFEFEMQKILRLGRTSQGNHLSDLDFDQIADLLCKANLEEWSFRPRTYAILKTINATDSMDDFVRSNSFDIALPYTRENLPQCLSQEQRNQFVKEQALVLTKAARLEGGAGAAHAYFPDNADKHLEPLNELGKGGWGTVDRVRSKLSRKIYVRKRLKREETFEGSAKGLNFFKNEIDHLKRLNHQHLVKYIGSYTDPEYVGIIMAPVADCDLTAFLSQPSFHAADYDCIREAFGCLCAAMAYLHRQQCRHKDIKPDNILVKQRSVYITDFGIARDWRMLKKSTTTGEIGPVSHAYIAPEVAFHDSRNSSSDIWSLGCVFLDMITVLKGQSLASKQLYFVSNGTQGAYPRVNLEAFEGWMKILKTTKDNAPLTWIKKMILESKNARLTAPQLMEKILSCEDDKDFFGRCCSGQKESEVPAELREEVIEDYSSNEELSDGDTPAKKGVDPIILDKHLKQAANDGDVKAIRRWLRRASNLRHQNLNSAALHHATSHDNEEIIDILIRFGCNLQFQLEDGKTALHVAMSCCHEKAAKLLARNSTKIGINAPNLHRNTPLHTAVHKSFHAGVRILLNAGARTDLRNTTGFTAFHIAAQKGDAVAVKLLIEYHADVSLKTRDGFSALQLATYSRNFTAVRTLLAHRADVDGCDNDADESKGNFPALFIAVHRGVPNMVRLLLQLGANINFQAKTNTGAHESALHTAVRRGLVEVVRSLLEFHPDLEARDFPAKKTVFISACRSRKIEIVKDLLTAGADVNPETEPDSTTILAQILQEKNLALAQVLVDGGASLTHRKGKKQTLLHDTVVQGNMEATEFLLSNKQDPNAQDVSGITPIMLAAERDRAAAMRMLLKFGASVEAADRSGCTALHFAAAAGSNETTTILLEHGTDPLAMTKRQETPLSLAHRRNYDQVEQQLLQVMEKADRVTYDSRWPNLPLYLSLEAVRHGYEVLDYHGRPIIQPLSHLKLLKPKNGSMTPLDRSSSPKPHPPGEASDSLRQPATSRSMGGQPLQPEYSDYS